jgi:hypothetical protein
MDSTECLNRFIINKSIILISTANIYNIENKRSSMISFAEHAEIKKYFFSKCSWNGPLVILFPHDVRWFHPQSRGTWSILMLSILPQRYINVRASETFRQLPSGNAYISKLSGKVCMALTSRISLPFKALVMYTMAARRKLLPFEALQVGIWRLSAREPYLSKP